MTTKKDYDAAIQRRCGTCGSLPGEPCTATIGRGKGPVLPTTVHRLRIPMDDKARARLGYGRR